MIRFVLLRLGLLAAALLLSSLLVYGALDLAPGSPIGALTGGRTLPPEQIEALRQQLHLDAPFLSRYWTWLSSALQGNFGDSITSRQPVADLVVGRLGTTLTLVAMSGVLIVLLAPLLGLLGAVRGGRTDTGVVAGTGMLAGIPAFVAAVVLVAVFSVGLGWFPVFGSGEGVADRLWHLTLPSIALALAAIGYVARVARTATLKELSREHVEVARSRGLASGRILRHHVLRNAMVPITTALGLTVASLIAGSVVVEQAFQLDGLGTLLIQAVNQHDFAVVQAVSLILVASFIVINTAVDLAYPLLDPRIRSGRNG